MRTAFVNVELSSIGEDIYTSAGFQRRVSPADCGPEGSHTASLLMRWRYLYMPSFCSVPGQSDNIIRMIRMRREGYIFGYCLQG